MSRKCFKVVLVLMMIFGITISILNFLPEKTEAAMIDQLLHIEFIDGGYAFKCFSTGNGCHTVVPDD